MSDRLAPTQYYGLRVDLVDRDPRAAAVGEDRAFGLRFENRSGARWMGRVPIVWVQGGVSWTEAFDLDLAPSETRSLGLATRWTAGAPALECRLPTEHSPREFLALSPARAESLAMSSRYVPLGCARGPDLPAPTSPLADRRSLLTQSAFLAVASMVAIVSAVLLIIYAMSVL